MKISEILIAKILYCTYNIIKCYKTLEHVGTYIIYLDMREIMHI